MSRRPASPSGRPPLELLDEFVATCDELAATRLIQQGFETGLVMQAGGRPGITIRTPMPDEDDFRSMLMALRPLIAEGEETSFNRIYNLSSAAWPIQISLKLHSSLARSWRMPGAELHSASRATRPRSSRICS